MTISHYNSSKKTFARMLRLHGTRGEARLWSEVLRNKGFYGLQFNRQFAIDKYIVDFICRKLKLIIEIDGASHAHKTEADECRDKVLAEFGYNVIRITERDVLTDMPNVIRAIEAFLPDDLLSNQSPLPPFQRGTGERGLRN